MRAPTLTTDRLTLRPAQASDFSALSKIWSDPDVIAFLGKPRSQQDVWSAMARSAGLWSLIGYGYWVLTERGNDHPLGEIGFADFKRGMTPDLSGRPEAGWVLAKSAWGKGYAGEAARAAHVWLDEAHPGRSTCIISPENTASIKLAKQLGYAVFAHSTLGDDAVLVLERNTPDARKC